MTNLKLTKRFLLKYLDFCKSQGVVLPDMQDFADNHHTRKKYTLKTTHNRTCEYCGKGYTCNHKNSKFCTATCKATANKKAKKAQ